MTTIIPRPRQTERAPSFSVTQGLFLYLCIEPLLLSLVRFAALGVPAFHLFHHFIIEAGDLF